MAGSRQADVAYRISSFQEILLKSTAVTLDGVGFLLMLTVVGEVATEVIGLSGDALFIVWFWVLGTKFFEGKASSKILTLMANAVLEAIPFVNGIYPGFSIAVWRLVRITKTEDEERAKNDAARQQTQEIRERERSARAIAIQNRRLQQAANDNAAELADAA